MKLKIKDKEYPCRVTLGAMMRFKRQTGKDIGEVTQNDATSVTIFLYCCVVAACHADGVPFDMELDMFADSIEPGALADFHEMVHAEQPQVDQKKTTV